MTDWKTYKDRVPWSNIPVVNKKSYNEGDRITTIDNSIWSPPGQGNTLITTQHAPCGYWSRDYIATPTPVPAFWDQVVTLAYGPDNSITSVVNFEMAIYAGSYNHGRLYMWDTVDSWVLKADQIGNSFSIYELLVFDGSLYACSFVRTLLRWNGTDAWVAVVTTATSPFVIFTICSFNLNLWGAGQSGYLVEWDGANSWTIKAQTSYSIAQLIVYNTKLYAISISSSTMFLSEYNGSDTLIVKASIAKEDYQTIGQGYYNAKNITEFNSLLYIIQRVDTTLTLYEWNGSTAFVAKATYTVSSAQYNYNLYTNGTNLYIFIGAECLVWDGVDTLSLHSEQDTGEDFEGPWVTFGSYVYAPLKEFNLVRYGF